MSEWYPCPKCGVPHENQCACPPPPLAASESDTSTTFTCSICHETFTLGQSDEAAQAECKSEFGFTPAQVPCDLVCDECYRQYQAWQREAQRNN